MQVRCIGLYLLLFRIFLKKMDEKVKEDLGEMGVDAVPAVSELAKLVRSEDREVRKAAEDALVKISASAPLSIEGTWAHAEPADLETD